MGSLHIMLFGVAHHVCYPIHYLSPESFVLHFKIFVLVMVRGHQGQRSVLGKDEVKVITV